MKPQNLRLLLPLLLLILTPLLMADVGPKPSAEFEIIYQVDPPPQLTGYAMFNCDLADCSDAYYLEQLGPQGFECWQDGCSSLAYGYGEYLYITLDFADGTSLTSNIFTKEKFDAEYEILVGPNSLTVTETGGSNLNKLGPLGGLIILGTSIPLCCSVGGVGLIVVVIVLVLRNTRMKEEGTE